MTPFSFVTKAFFSRHRRLASLLAGTVMAGLGAVAGAQAPVAGNGGTEPSPEAILAHPEAFDPFRYAILVKSLWASGRREQAAFWFYVFQIRSRPWAAADQSGDGLAELRGALNESMGSVINPWVASDLQAWKKLAAQAVAYERRLPASWL